MIALGLMLMCHHLHVIDLKSCFISRFDEELPSKHNAAVKTWQVKFICWPLFQKHIDPVSVVVVNRNSVFTSPFLLLSAPSQEKRVNSLHCYIFSAVYNNEKNGAKQRSHAIRSSRRLSKTMPIIGDNQRRWLHVYLQVKKPSLSNHISTFARVQKASINHVSLRSI